LAPLAETDIRLRYQDLDGRQLSYRLGDDRLGIGAACKIGGDATRRESDGENDNSRGFHTLYSLRYATDFEFCGAIATSRSRPDTIQT
jgi:hypothetical protein